MAISANYDWNPTSSKIQTAALRKVGVTDPDATDLSNVKFALNAIMKEFQHRKDFPWLVELQNFTCVDGTATYTLDADTADIEQVFVREDDYDYAVDIISRFDENDITDKSDTGRPQECRFKRTLDAQTLTLYPVPDDTYTVYYSKIRLVRNMDSDANNADVMVEWINALVYRLVADLADDYHLPLEERNWFQSKASALLAAVKRTAAEPEDEITVRGSYVPRCFVILMLLLFTLPAFGADTALQIGFITSGIMDSSGDPISNGTVGFYEVGHVGEPSYYKDTWQDANKTVANTNPLTLGSGGRAAVFADGRYDIEVKDSDGTLVFQMLGAGYNVGTDGIVYVKQQIDANYTDPTITLLGGATYETGANKLAVYVNGVREHYVTETSTTSFTLSGRYLFGWYVLAVIQP